MGPLEEGVYDVVVVASERLPVRVAGVRVQAGRATDLGDVRLATGAGAVGSVVSGGRPLAGVVVSAEGAGPETAQPRATSDGEGRFRLGPLPPGDTRLRLTKLGREVVRVPVRVPASGEVDVGTVELAARPAVAAGDVRRSPGIGLSAGHGGLEVALVVPGSAAEEAGLVAGARLTTVDGYPTEDLPPRDVMGLLLGAAGTRVAVEAVLPGESAVRGSELERR